MIARLKACFPAFVFLLVGGCTKDISLALNDAPSQLVIEGTVQNTAGPYYVQLSHSVSYASDSMDIGTLSAAVTITDNTAKRTDALKKVAPGNYATATIAGIAGHSYTMSVTVGKTKYSATSVMPAQVGLDSITFQRFDDAGKDITYVVAHFSDPPNVHNYYTFTESVNGVKLTKNTFVFDDRLSDGKEISVPLLTYDNYVHPQDTVSIEMGCVDENVYNYFYALYVASDPQNVSPANPVSNISNNALGYFSAQSVSRKSAVAPQ